MDVKACERKQFVFRKKFIKEFISITILCILVNNEDAVMYDRS